MQYHIYYWLINVLIHGIMRLDLAHASSCVETPCTSCQDCEDRQTITRYCQPRSSDVWPGAPSKLEVHVHYEPDPAAENGSNLYPYAYITVTAPASSSIKDLEGFQVEVTKLNTDEMPDQFCLSKNLTGCQFNMKNITQKFHFCRRLYTNDSYFFLANSLPSPGTGHLDTNSITTITKPVFSLISNTDESIFVTSFSYNPVNGTSNSSASVDISFVAGRARQFSLYFISRGDTNEPLEGPIDVNAVDEGDIITRTFRVPHDRCSGTFQVQIEPKNPSAVSCICPEIRRFACDRCGRIVTPEFRLWNQENFCRPRSQSTATPQIDKKDVQGTSKPKDSITEAVLITVMAGVLVLAVLAVFTLGIFLIRIKKVYGHMPPQNKNLEDFEDPDDDEKPYHEQYDPVHRKGQPPDQYTYNASAADLSIAGTTFGGFKQFSDIDEASRHLAITGISRNNVTQETTPADSSARNASGDQQPSDQILQPESALTSVSADSDVPTNYIPIIPLGKHHGEDSDSAYSTEEPPSVQHDRLQRHDAVGETSVTLETSADSFVPNDYLFTVLTGTKDC